ncbi:probable serine racemase [Mya arenaria]|uniref:probable serine racemase n=1 Tax=Mya arenaria TaxID=6604 RepID=UPI0022E470E9|nr:probable serine racemase [Mya arenaria]XP_052801793.1 probable serine racemase [Mya arenaria]
MSSIGVTLEDIRNAFERIRGTVKKTPVLTDEDFNEKHGRRFYFKCENMQRTGAFKIRGALNAVLSRQERGHTLKGLVAHSSGNHGRALAWVARSLGVPCEIVCPTTVPECKLADIKELGATLRSCEPTPQDRIKVTNEVMEERGFSFVPTCDDLAVIAGQGTVGLEIMEQVPALDAILVPVSGGGLAAGICIAAKAIKPDIKIYIVEPEGKELQKCLLAGERLWPNPPRCLDTVADGMRMQQLGQLTWPIVLQHAEKTVFTVTDDKAINGMRTGFQDLKLVVESAAGTVVAAAMSDQLKDLPPEIRHIGLIMCGGNVDLAHLPFL